jgi:hypothetical protein
MKTTIREKDLNKKSPYEKSFKLVKKINDPRLGNVSIL